MKQGPRDVDRLGRHGSRPGGRASRRSAGPPRRMSFDSTGEAQESCGEIGCFVRLGAMRSVSARSDDAHAAKRYITKPSTKMHSGKYILREASPKLFKMAPADPPTHDAARRPSNGVAFWSKSKYISGCESAEPARLRPIRADVVIRSTTACRMPSHQTIHTSPSCEHSSVSRSSLP